jgi:hypothetical protein
MAASFIGSGLFWTSSDLPGERIMLAEHEAG